MRRLWPEDTDFRSPIKRKTKKTKARTDLEVIEEAKRIKSAMALRGGRETREISTLYGRQEERHQAHMFLI
jgi:hypothetical protein